MNRKNNFFDNTKKIIAITFLVLFCITLAGAIKWSNFKKTFDIKTIQINGSNILNKNEYLKIFSSFNYKHINDIDIYDVARKFEKNSFVKGARISKHLPSTIIIDIIERIPLAIVNIEKQLMIDIDGITLPNHIYSETALIPVLSGFNSSVNLYPEGEKTFSIKVNEAIEILKQLSTNYPEMYSNTSELTLNENNDYVIILSQQPTKIILGKKNIISKLNILETFNKALGHRRLTDFKVLDMRYKKQLVVEEWS